MITQKKIDSIVSKIASVCNPDKIILFGSYALGNQTKSSDLDLLILMESDKPRHHRSIEIRKALIGSMIPIDIFVITPGELRDEISDKHSFIGNAIKNSKVLYERAS